MILDSGKNRYTIGKQVADADHYRLYLCIQEGTGRQCLLQVAKEIKENARLERGAYILGELKTKSDALEAEYALKVNDPLKMLCYDLGFPEVIESFICKEQGNRRINILAFRNVEEITNMVPLIGITQKDSLRVDLRTSAWIMGKALKLLGFSHDVGISVSYIQSNILIYPEQHYVLFFDWSGATIHRNSKVPEKLQRLEVSEAAKAVITALGGNYQTRMFPDDGDEAFDRYTGFILRLADGRINQAYEAHKQFYTLVDELWKREFYPFTSHPLN